MNLERLTAYHPNPDFRWGDEYVNDPPNPFAAEENKTSQQILAEYRAHADQLYRPQALLNTPEAQNDPVQMQYLLNQIAIQNKIMPDLAAEAAAAGITTTQLAEVEAATHSLPPTIGEPC